MFINKKAVSILSLLKGLIPVISYFLFVAMVFLCDKIDTLIGGVRESDTPIILPDWFVFVIVSPLILYGYLLLPIAQLLYRIGRKWFKLFAWILTALSLLLLFILSYNHISSWLFYLLIVFPTPLWFYIPFFGGLSYVFRKTEDTIV